MAVQAWLRPWPLMAVLLCLIAASGCAMVPKSRLSAAQSQVRSLSEQSRAQLAEVENLKVHSRSIEDQLIRAEGDLAMLDEKFGISRQKLANLSNERELLRDDLAFLSEGGAGVPLGVRGQLAELAKRHPHLHYDPQTGISKLDTDVLFDSGEDVFKPGAERMLREFASILNSPEAANLKLMVVGHTDNQRIAGRETRHRFPSNWHLSTARALAVSDYLSDLGIDGDRMGLAGFGQHQPIASNASPGTRQENRRVEIFVMSPDVPIVGMTETLTNLY
ncbi:MAG: OmpA family protein [Pirellulales bacterium]